MLNEILPATVGHCNADKRETGPAYPKKHFQAKFIYYYLSR